MTFSAYKTTDRKTDCFSPLFLDMYTERLSVLPRKLFFFRADRSLIPFGYRIVDRKKCNLFPVHIF